MFRPRHRVSAKAAIYSADASKILIMSYAGGKTHGLAGGHVERNESPDTTIVREIEEELGVTLPEGLFKRRDFFKARPTDDRIIVAYAAHLPGDIAIRPIRPQHENGVWLTKAELTALTTISDSYKQFALAQWPTISV